MTNERMNTILRGIIDKHSGSPSKETGKMIHKDITAVLRGLQKTENFLESIEVEKDTNNIYISNLEEYKWLGLLPYLYENLRGKSEDEDIQYIYHITGDGSGYLMTAINFIDLFKNSEYISGYSIKEYEVDSLGMYYPVTNDFIRL